MKNALRILLLCVGLGLFGWFIHHAGPGEILKNVRSLGWFAPLVLTPFAVVYLCDTLGWYFSFGSYTERKPAYLTLVRLRWAGESVNSLIPSAYIGGEAVKVYLLSKRGFPTSVGATSAIVSKTSQVLAQVIFIGIGAFAARSHLPPDSTGRPGMTAIAVIALVVIGLLFWLQSHGMFTTLRKVASFLPFRFRGLEAKAEEFRRMDDQVLNFYNKDRRRFFFTTLTYLAGWLFDTLEVYLVCHLLGHPIDWSEAVAIEAFIGVAKALGIFVPGSLGVQESGVVLLFHLFGLPEALGIAYAIIRRGRELVYVSIGALLLYSEEADIAALSTRLRKQHELET